LVLEELILRYYLKIFSIIFAISFFYIIYIFLIKDIKLNNPNILIKKNQNISSLLSYNLNDSNRFNIFLYSNFLKLYNHFSFKIHYGEFLLKKDSNFYQFTKLITQPSNIIKRITIVEGWTYTQLNELLKKHFENFNKIEHSAILADTFFLNSSQTFDDFKKKLINFKNSFFKNRINNPIFNDYTVKDLIILGSLIEKEGIDYIDKKKIFSVLINRLNKNMKLQIDATVIYAITEGKYKLNRNLTYNDLKINHPYNTYFIYGLPPEPISYVGLKTIELMLENYTTDYLFYFYNKFDEKHIFSKTYLEHKQKLNEYRAKE